MLNKELMAQARRRYEKWLTNETPRRLNIKEESGMCACQVVMGSGLIGFKNRLKLLCAYVSTLSPLSAWKIFWYRRAGVKIGKNVHIAQGAKLDPLAPHLISLGDNYTLGIDCLVVAHRFNNSHLKLRRIHIGSKAVVGAKAIAAGSLGDNSTLMPASLLALDGPANVTLIGVPAKIQTNYNFKLRA